MSFLKGESGNPAGRNPARKTELWSARSGAISSQLSFEKRLNTRKWK